MPIFVVDSRMNHTDRAGSRTKKQDDESLYYHLGPRDRENG